MNNVQYDWKNPEEALEMVKLRILESAAREEKWYRGARRAHSGFSRAIRGCSIILFTLGALFPMLNLSFANQQANIANQIKRSGLQLM